MSSAQPERRIRAINVRRNQKLDPSVEAAIRSCLANDPTASTKAIHTYLNSIGMKASISYVYGVRVKVVGKKSRATVPFTAKRRGRPRKQDQPPFASISAAVALVHACNGDFEQVHSAINLVQKVAEAKWA